MALYTIFNGPMPTTASFAAVTTGTSIKTLLQLKPFNVVKIVEWGISFDGAAAAAGIEVELLDTGTVFATVTASADADVMKLDGAEGAVASVAGLTLGTSATGYTSSAEGTITAIKLYDVQLVQPTGQYVKQFPLGREPKCIIGNSVRIRVKAAAAVNAIAYMVLEI
jgi:hypothetical protein